MAACLKIFMGLPLVHFQKYWLLSNDLQDRLNRAQREIDWKCRPVIISRVFQVFLEKNFWGRKRKSESKFVKLLYSLVWAITFTIFWVFSRFGSYTDETFTKEGKVHQLEKLVSGKTKFLQAIPVLYVEMSIYLLIIRIWNLLSNLLMSTVDLFTRPKRREFVKHKTRNSCWLLIKLGILVFWL